MDSGQRLFDAGAQLLLSLRQGLNASLGDLNLPQFRVLSALDRCPEATLAEQARLHGVTPPAMSKMVDGLVARGLVVRVQDVGDRRINRHTLTAEGVAVVMEVRQHIAQRLQARIAGLGADDQAALHLALPAIHRLAEVDA